MMNKKKILIISGLTLIVLAIIFLALVFIKNRNKEIMSAGVVNNGAAETILEPEFMDDAQKERFGLPQESKIQVLKKDASGTAEVYRVIRRDEDIVLDPSRISDPNMIKEAAGQ